MNRIDNVSGNGDSVSDKREVKISIIKRISLEEEIAKRFIEAGYRVLKPNLIEQVGGYLIIRERPPVNSKFLFMNFPHSVAPLHIADFKIMDPSKQKGSLYYHAKKHSEESGLPEFYETFTKFFGNPLFMEVKVYGEKNLNDDFIFLTKKAAEDVGIDRIVMELADKIPHTLEGHYSFRYEGD